MKINHFPIKPKIVGSSRALVTYFLGFVICICFASSVSAVEPKLVESLRGATSKSDIERLTADQFRIEKQSENKWLIYSRDEYQLRPAAVIEFQGNKVIRQIHLSKAAASSENLETISFVETFYKLLEILKQKGNETATVSLTSYKIRGVDRKIIELRFDDRIISLDVWRDPGDLQSVSVQAIRPEDSFFH